MTSHKTIRVSCLLAGALLFSASAFAQGKVQVAGFGGGMTIADGGGTHALVGGSAGIRVTGHVRVFGEFSLVPLASASLSESGVNASGSDKLYNFGGGMDYSFGSSKRVVPYAVVALGASHEVLSATASGNGVSASLSMTSNAVYIGVGGGVRFYAGDNWGFKPEFRYERFQSSSGGGGGSNTAVFAAGIFYQFGK